MIESLQALFTSNAIVSGGFALGVLGVLALWLRSVPKHLWSVLRRELVSTLAFDNRDPLMFATLVEYMDSRDVLRGINQFTVRGVKQSSDYTSFAEDVRQGLHPEVFLSPGEGFHIFRLDGRLMWMTREVQVAQSVLERITLSTLGRNKAPLEAFIRAAIAHRIARELHKIAIYVPNPFNHSDWMRAKLGNNRKLSSIVLKEGQVEQILEDLPALLRVPGSVREPRHPLAQRLSALWTAGHRQDLAGDRPRLRTRTQRLQPESCIGRSERRSNQRAVLERAGAVDHPRRGHRLLFRNREQASGQMKLSFSGFINALDGIASHEGSVVFMTTNAPEVIDEAVIRSGRVDFRMELSRCDRHQLQKMFLKFFADDGAAGTFAAGSSRGAGPRRRCRNGC